MLACFLAMAMVQSPLDAPITLDNQPSRMDVVLDEIGRQAGIRIKVTGAPLRDYVYVHLDKRSLRSTLDLIAEASKAAWREEGGEIILSAPWPPSDKESQELRRKMIQEWLDKNPVPPALTAATGKALIEEALRLNKGAGEGYNWQQINDLDRKAPLGRLQVRLLHAIGADEISEIELGDSRIYSLSGNPRIHALPASAKAMIADFMREAASYKDLVSARGAQAEVEDQGYYLGSLHTYFYADFSKVDSWFVRFQNQFGQISMSLIAGSSEQEGTVLNGDISITTMNGMSSEQPPQDDAFSKFTEGFPLPEDWTKLPDAPNPAANGGQPRISQAIRDRLISMDKDEILTDYADDPIRFLAKTRSIDAVAIIPDAAFLIATMGRLGGAGSEMSVGALLRSFYMFNGGEVIEGEKSLIFRPEDLVQSRKMRVPREATANMIHKAMPAGEADLDTCAELAAATEDDMSLMFAVSIAGLVLGEINLGMADPQMLRFYGNFPAGQRRNMKERPVTITYGSLNKAQRSIMEKMLYAGTSTLITKEALEVSNENFYMDGGMTMHPAVKYPEGIPNNAPITLRFTSKDMLYAQQGEGSYASPINLDQLAWSKAYAEKGGEDYMSYYKLFAFAPQKKFHVELALGELFFQKVLDFGGPKAKTKFVPFDQLPADTLKEFNELLQKKRDEVKDMDIQPPTRRNPPPP